MSHRLIFSLLNSLSHVECGLRVDLSDREDASSRVKYLCYVKERIIYHIQKGARKSLCDSPLQGRFFDQYWSVK